MSEANFDLTNSGKDTQSSGGFFGFLEDIAQGAADILVNTPVDIIDEASGTAAGRRTAQRANEALDKEQASQALLRANELARSRQLDTQASFAAQSARG